MLTARDLREILSDGLVWCYEYRAVDQTCTTVERLRSVDRQGFTIDQFFMFDAEGTMIKVESVQSLRFEQARACSSFDQQVQTMRFYFAGTAEAAAAATDRSVGSDINERFIEVYRDERTRAGDPDESCYGWRVVGREPWELQEIKHIDGVAQPNAKPIIARLFPLGTDTLRLRASNP